MSRRLTLPALREDRLHQCLTGLRLHPDQPLCQAALTVHFLLLSGRHPSDAPGRS